MELPWQTKTDDNLDIKAASKVLEANHYGLPKVKERILEYLAVRKLSEGKLRSPVLCFVGAPASARPAWAGLSPKPWGGNSSASAWAVSATKPRYGVTVGLT